MLLTKARDKGTLPRLSNFVGQYWGTNGDFIAFRGGVGNFKAGQGGPCGHILMEDLKNTPSPSGLVELVVPKSDAFPGSSLYVGLGLAPPVGFFTYNKVSDNVSVTWPSQLDPRLKDSVAGSQAMIGKLNSANPGSFNAFFTADPGYINSGGPALTAHPVGGAVAGKVCDYYGRVHGHPGLYVVDGAFVPGGSVGGVNPSFTIAALAERSMERIIQRGDEN
jgi:cholesterol oxidase